MASYRCARLALLIFSPSLILSAQEISAEITKRTTTQVEPSSTRLQRAALNQTKLAARLMAVIAQLHPLTTHRGAPLRADEEALFNRIAAAQTEFANGPTRLPAMLNELWVQVASRRAAMQAQSGEKEGKEWEVANEEELGKILEVRLISPPSRRLF